MMLEIMRTALATERAGSAVAARLFFQFPRETTDLEGHLAMALESLEQLFESTIDSIHVFGSLASGQLSGLARFSRGQSALIAIAATGEVFRSECFVFAERGTLRWALTPDDVPAGGFPPFNPSSLSESARESWERIRVQLSEGRSHTEPRPFPEPENPIARKPPYGVLLVSGDHTHQPGYAEALAADPRCRLVAVTDDADVDASRREKNEQLASRLKLPYLDDLDAALERDDVHIVSVCAEPYRRGRIIVKAAQAGKHLYLDKPLCGSQADADAIVAAVRNAGVVAHMFSQVCFAPAIMTRQRLESGIVGDLTAIHADLCFAKGHAGTATLGTPRDESPQPTRFELADAKRELTNVGIYHVVKLLWLVRQRVRRVVATTGNYFFTEHQANDMEDFGQVLLEFDSGVTATISAGRLGWQSHPSSGLHRTTLVGTKATTVIDAHQPRVELWTATDAWQPPARNPEDPMGMWQAPPGDPFQAKPKLDWIVSSSAPWQLDSGHFLDCVEQGRASDVPAELAAFAMEILLAAYRSAATGQVIEL